MLINEEKKIKRKQRVEGREKYFSLPASKNISMCRQRDALIDLNWTKFFIFTCYETMRWLIEWYDRVSRGWDVTKKVNIGKLFHWFDNWIENESIRRIHVWGGFESWLISLELRAWLLELRHNIESHNYQGCNE